MTGEDLGAWVLKADPARTDIGALAAERFVDVGTWCVRPGRRAALVEPGQPVLLWVSGSSRSHPSGLHARGRTTGRAAPAGDTWAVALQLEPVHPPVLRTDLRAHPVLAGIEVLRMPAGSNPSYLTRGQYDALLADWPHLA